jgi:ketosteroid isomerase-like protein
MADGQEIYVRVESADVRGNALIQSGVWSVQVTNPYGERAYGGGNFTRILDRQEDGSWKIRMESWEPAAMAARDSRVSQL